MDRRHAFGLAALTVSALLFHKCTSCLLRTAVMISLLACWQDAARWVTQGFTTNHNVFLDALGELLPSSTAPTPGGASYAAAVGGGATAHSGSSSASAGGGASLGAAAAAASSQHGAPSFQHWPSCDLGSLAQLAPPDSTALLDGGEQLGMHKVRRPQHLSSFINACLRGLRRRTPMDWPLRIPCLTQRQPLPAPPPPQVRVVLLYSRSGVVPRWAAAPLGQLPLDAIYIHQKALPGVNCPQVSACWGRRLPCHAGQRWNALRPSAPPQASCRPNGLSLSL